jgi:hypothetical protein
MATLLLLAASAIIKENLEEEIRRHYDFHNLPAILVEAFSIIADEGLYETTTNAYNEDQFQFAQRYISAVPPDTLGHSDLNCITSKSSFGYF